MASLTRLPTEIRQLILLLALPPTNRVDSPTNVLQLFHINQRLRMDMSAVIALWSPVHYISSPPALARLTRHTLDWKIERVCLDLFHASSVDRITWTCYCRDPAMWTHPELIAAWADAVTALPRGVEQVWLDVTPAPGAKRARHRMVLDQFVGGKCAGRKFLAGHVGDVAALVGRVEEWYGGGVRVVLTGRLSAKSAFFVESVSAAVGRELEFVGTWVSAEEARFARIGDAVQRATSRKKMWAGKQRGDRHPLVWLRDVAWDRRSGFLYARLADEGLEMAALEDLVRIAEVQGGEGRLVLPPTSSLRRAFQHRVAADLGLQTIGDGEGDGRHVVVSV